ncbi:MAG: type II toxin-antitoxin system VapC family toxin [Acidimicrobiales bacterium]
MVDTGPLVAAALRDDPDHRLCVAWFEQVREPLVVPDLLIPEVTYLLAAGARTRVEADFLRSLVSGQLAVEHVGGADLERAAELVETYADLALGTVDAVVAIAERLDASKVATLDRRHFTVVRPTHVPSFELVP